MGRKGHLGEERTQIGNKGTKLDLSYTEGKGRKRTKFAKGA